MISHFSKHLLSNSLWWYISLFFASSLIILFGCGTSSPTLKKTTNNSEPLISIQSPQNNESQSSTNSVLLTGSALDEEDGNISNNISWESNIDGFLGNGASLNVSMSEGSHTITASITDSDKASTSTSITYSIILGSGVVTISWVAPTENTDNTPLTDLSGYKIYYGTVVEVLDNTKVIETTNTNSSIIENLVSGTTYYFEVSAFNSQGVESRRSERVSKFIEN